MSLKSLQPLVPTFDVRVAKPAERQIEKHYGTEAHKRWAEQIKARAGFWCEALDDGRRCDRRHPEYVMYADHIVEIKDGGAETDLNNGQCLCASHHVRKTNGERIRRFNEDPVASVGR